MQTTKSSNKSRNVAVMYHHMRLAVVSLTYLTNTSNKYIYPINTWEIDKLKYIHCTILTALLLLIGIARLDAQTIIIPQSPTETETFAANELQTYLSRILNKKVDLLSDNKTHNQGLHITVGRTQSNQHHLSRFEVGVTSRGPDSYVMKVNPQRVELIGGSDRGTLYAVYAFLEMQGCRWYSPWEADHFIPQRKVLNLTPTDVLHIPTFVQRDIGHETPKDSTVAGFIDWMAKNRLNHNFAARQYHLNKAYRGGDPNRKAWVKRGDHMRWQWICHNFAWFFKDVEKTFEEHPEYFSLYKNRRINIGTAQRRHYGGGNLCTTNPDVIKLAADFAIKWFDDHPTGTVVPMWPGDGAIKWCECDNCNALGGKNFTTGPEGSMSRRMVTFVNAVAKQVAPKHPDRLLLLPAYANYIDPVEDLSIEPNIMVQYCYHADYAHGPMQSSLNSHAVEQMKAWAQKVPGRFGVWEYFLIGDYTVKNHVPVVLPLIYRVRDTVQFFKSIGTRYYFTQSTSAYHRYNTLLYYALARYLDDPDLDADELIREYCENQFGEAAQPMTTYYMLLEQAVEQADWHPQLYADVTTPSPLVWTDKIIQSSSELLKQAHANNSDSRVAKQLAMVQEAHDQTLQSVRTQNMAGLDAKTIWRLQRNEDTYIINADGKEADAKRQQQLALNALDQGQFDPRHQRLLFRSRKRSIPLVKIQNDALQLTVVPEIGGRIVRIIDRKTGWNFIKEKPGDDTLDQLGASYFAYGGYEEYASKAFAGAGWETPFTSEQITNSNGTTLKLTAEVDDYRLVRTISLGNGMDTVVKIESVLTNLSGESRSSVLRVHPSLTLGQEAGNYPIWIRDPAKQIHQGMVVEHHDGPSIQTDGFWAIANPLKNRAVIHTFDPSQASAYLFCSEKQDYFNMELIGQPKALAPNESLAITQTWRVINDAKSELPQWIPGAVVEKEPAPKCIPIGKKVSYVPGKIGKAAYFDATANVSYDTHNLRMDAGTIAMWVQLPIDLADAKGQFLFGTASNNPDWTFAALDQGKLSLLIKKGRSPYHEPGKYYTSLNTPIENWKANTWHHVAITWQVNPTTTDQSTICLYMDGKIIEERNNVTLTPLFGYSKLHIGQSSANAKHKATLNLDELYLSRRVLSDQQVLECYQLGRDGQPITPDNDTLLCIGFEESVQSR
ncbi:MAG TPA: hypothetical protein DER01_21520 [Phycisphaerales bacterium]|nr:hypothetical protein [Phycisphaerales bacterium]